MPNNKLFHKCYKILNNDIKNEYKNNSIHDEKKIDELSELFWKTVKLNKKTLIDLFKEKFKLECELSYEKNNSNNKEIADLEKDNSLMCTNDDFNDFNDFSSFSSFNNSNNSNNFSNSSNFNEYKQKNKKRKFY